MTASHPPILLSDVHDAADAHSATVADTTALMRDAAQAHAVAVSSPPYAEAWTDDADTDDTEA